MAVLSLTPTSAQSAAVYPLCLLAPCLTLCCLPAPTFSLLPTASFKDLWVGGEGLVGTSLPFAVDEVGNCPEAPEGAHWHYPCSTALLSGHQWTSPFSATPNFLLLQLLDLWPLRSTTWFHLSCLHSPLQLPSTSLCQPRKPSYRKASMDTWGL